MFDSEVQAKAAQFHALAAELACAVTSDTAGAVAAEALIEVIGGLRQAELTLCRLMERVDRTGEYAVDGAASAVAHLRTAAQERSAWAAKRVHVGRGLADRLPITRKHWEAGRLGLDHAAVIEHTTRGIDDDALSGEVERILAEAAAGGLSPTDLERLAAQVRAQVTPEQAEARATDQYRQQRLSLAKTFGGMWDLRATLDPETGLFISQALQQFMPSPPTAEQRRADPGDVEPVGRRRVHALSQLARHALAHAEGCNGEGGGRHTVVVATTLDQLRDEHGIGQVEGGQPVIGGALRRLACDANVLPVVLGADSAILDIGRRTRLISAALRHSLALRDGGCVFPDCDRPPSWCEAHHREPWSAGGRTDRCNLDLLCSHHHHLIHEGWTYRPIDDETLEFHPPGGRPPLRSRRRPLLPRPRERDRC